MDNPLHPELTRANKARHAAIDARAKADGTGIARTDALGWLEDARCWDALADKIIEAMNRGEKPPLFDLTSPRRG